MAFFDFDYEEIVNGDGFITSQIDMYGDGVMIEARQKQVDLNPPQMGMFDTLNVTSLPDGTIWLDFFSRKYAPNKTLMDFMAYCTEMWGKDSKGQGVPCNRDTELLKRGKFGRYWPNVKIIQFKRPEVLSLTITLRIIIDNQDMSNFAKQLAKGFVRAAVNQVGRDGGRVISNQVYNGQNYVPVAEVPPQPLHGTPPPPNPATSITPTTPVSKTRPFTAGKMVWLTLASIFLAPIGSLVVMIYGIFIMLDRSDEIEWFTSEPHYVQDRRYKTGVRYVGNRTHTHKTKVEASPDVMAVKKRNGTIAIIIGGIGLVLFTIIMIFAN